MNIRKTEIERQGVEETPKGIVHATKQKPHAHTSVTLPWTNTEQRTLSLKNLQAGTMINFQVKKKSC